MRKNTAALLAGVLLALLASGGLATAAVRRTEIEIYVPWALGGTLAHGVRIVGRTGGGECWTGSLAVGSDPTAWRCSAPGHVGRTRVDEIYDPCFAPTASLRVGVVACAASPWSGVTLVRLTHALASPRTGLRTLRPGAGPPWALVLGNGARCGIITGTGTTAGGVVLDYGCTHGAMASTPARSSPWTVEYLPRGSAVLRAVRVSSAWY